MLDDDIVYLGTRNNTSTPARSPQHPVTGIALHVDKSGGMEAHGMLFRRTNTSVIHIGRRSGFDSDKRSEEVELSNAMFRCAVVSRKHAKIAFSDSGLAYLIDLRSHHGTHIRKSGDKFSKSLKPETPTLLSDGDIVTFGKSVGKNEECVRPVVARIELLYSGNNTNHSTSPIKPLVVPSNDSPSSDKSSVKSNSGRYGINDTSSSSDESSFKSGSYSDIEEIPAPTTSSPKASTSQNLSSSTGLFLKRLLPPSHTANAPRRDFLPSLSEIVEKPLAHVSMFFSSFGPESVPTSPGGYRFSPLAPIPDLERSVSPLAFARSDFLPVGFDASQHDIYEISDHVASKSRSHSPMDLASPSPPRQVIPPAPVHLPPLLLPPVSPKQIKDLDPASDGPTSSSSEKSTMTSENALVEGSGDDGGANSALLRNDLPQPSDLVETTAQMKKFEELLEKLQFDVSKLHHHRRKYKARFNSSVEVISGKLAQFDDRLAEVNAEYTIMFDQVDTIHHVDIPDLQAQLGALQERVDDLPDPFSDFDPRGCTPQAALHEREDVKDSIQTLRSLVDEMRILREQSQVQMASELEAIRAMRETAMTNIAEAQAQATKADQTPVLPSLKRKRDDTDENEELCGSESIQQGVDVEVVDLANQDKDVVMDEEVSVPSTKLKVLAASPTTHRQLDAPSPRKRARCVASVLARTATAVTLGAVVTWSALAFS